APEAPARRAPRAHRHPLRARARARAGRRAPPDRRPGDAHAQSPARGVRAHIRSGRRLARVDRPAVRVRGGGRARLARSGREARARRVPRSVARRRVVGALGGRPRRDRTGLERRRDGRLPADVPLPVRARGLAGARPVRIAARRARAARRRLTPAPAAPQPAAPTRVIHFVPAAFRRGIRLLEQEGVTAMPTMHEIDYEILGDDMQFVKIEMDPGEAVVGEAGAMMYVEDGIALQTIFGDGSPQQGGFMNALLGAGKRLLTGESLFMTVFQNQGQGKRRAAFAAPYPGKIIALNLQQIGGELLAQKDSFLVAAKGVSI